MDLFNQPAPTGEELKQEGIAQAINHANAVEPTWGDRAFALFSMYIHMHPEKAILKTEDARQYAEEQGLEEPPTKRAWGAIALRAARAGLIVKQGYTTCDNPKTHKGLTTLWLITRP